MSSNGGITATSLRAGLGFNWVFLIELIVCGVLALFFLFYFNRVFATFVSYGIRAWSWHRYRIYIDIQALQISLVGGRIFFKGFRYHGNNETILVHSGFVTWRYWLRNVKETDLGRGLGKASRFRSSSDSEKDDRRRSSPGSVHKVEGGGLSSSSDLPCRFNVSLKGVEWFVYNRSAAYDAIVGSMTEQNNDIGESIPCKRHENLASENSVRKRGGDLTMSEKTEGPSSDSPLSEQNTVGMDSMREELGQFLASKTITGESNEQTSQDNFMLRLLPIDLECQKAAVVLGNENTKSVLITKAEKVTGEIDATQPTLLDQYKQVLNFKFHHPVIQMKPNDDYKEDQSAAASKTNRETIEKAKPKQPHIHSHSFLHRYRRKALHGLQNLVPALRSSVESLSSTSSLRQEMPTEGRPGSGNWQGLARYLDENEQDEKARWSAIEYATVSTIVDSPEATLRIYWDSPGLVPHRENQSSIGREEDVLNINGATSPEWGVELSFKGATINYGPWADRQRAGIQRVFFPNLSKDAVPGKRILPGQLRIPTQFKLFIEFVEDTTVRVPIREESKNWKWAKQADTMGEKQEQGKRDTTKSRRKKSDKGNPGSETRPFGWLDVKVAANASVAYTMDMIATDSGFSNTLEIDLPSVELTTSVNHGLLWRSANTRISCDLSNPLQWNGCRTWKFDIASDKLELFLLREHIFLLIDLIDDWGTGPPPEYLTFSPFQYLVSLNLTNFKLFLNVNDSNIINNPSDMDDNTFMIIFGSVLSADIRMPMDKYRPVRNAIPFNVDLEHGGLKLHVPPWNTQATFLASTEMAQLKALAIRGTYQYCSTTSTSNTDTLLLDIHGYGPTAYFYGFFVRYLLKIKDNYFGDDIRFKTLEEYQNVLQTQLDDDIDDSNSQPHKKSNDLDVIMTVTVDDSNALLPSNLYSAKDYIGIGIERITADLRFTNYYMDLDLTFGPLAFSPGNGTETTSGDMSNIQLFVDGIHISGDRLFGLPPTEPTYVCNWDFAVGAVTGECNIDFFSRLAASAKALAFSFDDDENALPSILPLVLHDVTFLRASVESVRIWLRMDSSAFLLSSGKIRIGFNDWAGSHYSVKLKVQVPDLRLGCVDVESALRHKSKALHQVETHAVIETSLSLMMIQRKSNFIESRQLQQEHLKLQDQRTHRADFLLHHELLDESVIPATDPPAMSAPPLPIPLYNDDEVKNTSLGSKTPSDLDRKRPFIRRKSSYLSLSSSISRSDASVLHSQRPKVAQKHKDSRSRGLDIAAGPGRPTFLRDVSASTGRQSSFHSAVGEPRDKCVPVTVSSSYLTPHYPLESIEPDIKDLPSVSLDQEDASTIQSRDLELEDVDLNSMDEDTTHVSFILELPAGIKGTFNPNAAYAVAELMTLMQASDPASILDELQVDCISDIFAMEKQKMKRATTMDFGLRTPGISLRFLNSTPAAQPTYSVQDTHDQYDVSMSGLALTFRSRTLPFEGPPKISTRKSSSVHFSMASLNLAVKERFDDLDDPQAAVNGVVEDVSFWTASSHDTSASVVFNLLELTTASSKIEYLASLVHRTDILANTLKETFMSRTKQQRNRVRLFTYIVATTGQQTPDPLFLTRPSYVLRSAPDHLRTSDSWKVVTRLRQIYTSLDAETQGDIATRCLYDTEPVPKDAGQRVLASFNQWRDWDMDNINSCLVMAKVFESADQPSIGPSQSPRPMSFSFRTERVRLILDPGPKQNEISMSNITTTITSRVDNLGTGEASPSAKPPAQDTVLQVFCTDISVNLNWELCELADDILRLYHMDEPIQPTPADISPPITVHSPRLKHNLHIFVATTNGSIALETINLKTVSISKGLTSSFVVVNETEGNTPSIANLILAAEATSSKIRSHSQDLSIFQLRHPSVYVSYEAHIQDGTPDSVIKCAANSQELSLIIGQDILALTEVLDLVIGDEVAQLHHLRESLPRASTPIEQPLDAVSMSPPINKVNIALFLDEYYISVLLLPTLTYNVTGTVARASIAARLNSEIIFDFDIKEHSHDVQTSINNKKESVSFLQMPPTNGRITTHMSEKENSVSVFASVEPIEFDAAAIHSLLTTINKPEISSVVVDIQEEVKAVRAHIEDIFGRRRRHFIEEIPSQSKPFIYDTHLTLAGFNVLADSQGSNCDHITARLEFEIGCVQLVLANRLEQQGPVLAFPELRVGIRHIMVQLSRSNNEVMVPCGNLSFAVFLNATSKLTDSGEEIRSYHLRSDTLEINLLAETVSSLVDIMSNLQDKIKDLDLTREKEYLRKLRSRKTRIAIDEQQQVDQAESDHVSAAMFASRYSFELLNIQISWLVGSSETALSSEQEMENLVFSLKRIDLSTKKQHTARLAIEDLQLQMVPESHEKNQRSLNSALLPEVIFNVGYVSTACTRRLAFQAAGKSLDLRLTSQLIIPAAILRKSISSAAQRVRAATASWTNTTPETLTEEFARQPFFGKKRMESLLVDADFAGAVVYLSGRKTSDTTRVKGGRVPQTGKYGQFTHTDASSNTVLRSPGLACKVEYKDGGVDESSLNAEVKIDASSNILYPAVVPLILEITSTIKDVVKDDDEHPNPVTDKPLSPVKAKSGNEENILTVDPSTILGRTRLNLGIRICRQEFSLSCQPIARVAATSRFDNIYLTVNTVRSIEHGHFFAASASIKSLQTSVQHVYSRESTGSFGVDSVFLSLMNSKHVSGTSGVSAILKISPMKVLVNAKQLQDFLLFREIWVPVEIRQTRTTPVPTSTMQPHNVLVQRYQQVAATAAFPWNATVSVEELDVQIDFGQAIGKSAFMISNFWISSKKNSDWEQNLCLGFDKVGVECTGRMSGFVTLQDFKIRTSIQWPAREMALNQTPLVQGSLGFSQLRVKAAFDYQAFLVADITSFELLMYNVRHGIQGDRLVAVLDGEAVQVFCTTTSVSQGLALYQAFLRLAQEKRANYEASLTEIEKFMKRKSVSQPVPSPRLVKHPQAFVDNDKAPKSPISLQTDVIVTLKAVNMGAFPNAFSDHQVFKIEALDAQARFAVMMEESKIHSVLGLTLGQLRIGLAGVKTVNAPQSVEEVTVEYVVASATGSRGGTILKVPKVEASMQTWQQPGSTHIDYIFKSSFEGKVEVGWNYSRISYIRGMWGAHSKALAQRLGKPLPLSAVRITGVPDEEGPERKDGEQQKITAEVNVPQSKYDYTALEPPVIETPQLRDMGEATPPLEWIGLHRDRLPNLTHQIVIVTLLELASEVEEAYTKILGTS